MSGKTKSNEYTIMTETKVSKLVLRLALPTVITMLITSVYNIADTYFVSTLGNSATGAVSIVFSIQSIIQAFGYGFGMGTQSLISIKLGQKDKETAEKYAITGFFGALIMGIIIAILGLIDVKWVMTLFGSTKSALKYSCEYGTVILLGAPIFCSSFVLSNILRSEGKSFFSMVGLCTGGILNIGLDALFVIGLNMGVRGAAIATVTSQCISFVILYSFFLFKKSYVLLNIKNVSKHPKDYLYIFRKGLPTVCRQGMGSLSTTMLNRSIRAYTTGDAALAAISIANKIYVLLRSMIIGFGQGFMPVSGFNYGAGKIDRVKKSFKFTLLVGAIFSLSAAVFVYLSAPSLIAIFRKGDTEVIKIGSNMLGFFAFSLPFLSYSTYVNQLFQSLGKTAPATFLASCRQGVFFIPLIFILPYLFGLVGIEITQALADVLTFVIAIPFQIHLFKKELNDVVR